MMSKRRSDLLRLLVATGACAATLLLSSAAGLAQEGEATVQGQPETGDAFTGDGESGAALPEMVVEAENTVRRDVHKPTFALELTAAVIDSFFTPVDDEALGISPVSGLQPHLNNLERLATDQTPHYWLQEMSTAPVVTFYPEDPEGHRPKSWSLAVTDFRGATFKHFEGNGRPSEKLPWDGRSDRGQMLQVGYPYSYVFSITDKGTNTYNYAGVSFRISALDYRREGDRRLEFAGHDVFLRDAEQLTEEGHEWLTRASDEVRRHPYSPIRVQVIAESEELAEKRAAAVATFLAESMILPREQVETEAIQKVDLRAEMDGSVTIIIEHAS
jgi:hypothetical protein